MRKKQFLLVICIGALTWLLHSCSEISARNYHSDSDPFIEDLIARMSLEEKVGQMTQVTIDLILEDNSRTKVSESKLRKAVLEKKVGSILNVKGGAYDLKTWHKIISSIQELATQETPNKIPVIYGIDAIHGMSYTQGSVLFPHNSGIGAARNREIAKKSAKVTAMQSRASGIRWNFDPMLGVARNPLWSRFEESYGEDPYLAGELGSQTIIGYEEDGLDKLTSVASCAKHYLGYSNPASGKDRTPAYIPERQLRQFYLPPFEKAIKAGASTVMVNSGEINGIPVHSNAYLLQDVLRGELGFEGVVVTDWEDIIRLHTRDRVAATPKEAVRIGVEAGIDLSMVPLDYSFYDYLLELVKEGTISETRIDESVRRILTLKRKLGLFERPTVEEAAIKNYDDPSYRELALNAARESMTLLKNEKNILPLNKSSKVLIAGPAANNLSALHSSWSYTWQGQEDQFYPKSTQTIKEAIADLIGSDHVVCSAVRNYQASANYDEKRLKQEAQGVDAIVLCLGEKAYAESPGIINDLTLDARQLDLAQAAVQTGKPVILVLVEGRPRIISSVEKGLAGVLMAYRPSTMGAQAIAETLFGDNNPSGRLPFTYPRFTNDLTTYDHKFSEKFTEAAPGNIQADGYYPQWGFGEGLSYTQFDYKNLTLSSSTLKKEGSIKVAIDITNSGKTDGAIAVEMYCKDLFASITPPIKQLKGFEKIVLKKGETQTVAFKILPEDLFFIDANNQKIVEEGEFEVNIGTEKAKFYFDNDKTMKYAVNE